MIKNETEYQEMLKRLEQDQTYMREQWQALRDLGLSEGEVDRAMQPTQSFHAQLREEVEYYERIKRGEFETLENFFGLGRLLIALRIAKGLTQRQLAERLGVSESQVSRDERSEYHGVTVARATKILQALGVVMTATVSEWHDEMASGSQGYVMQ